MIYMLKKWTNSYLIFVLTVLGIILAYFETNLIQVILFNFVFFWIMLLIFLREIYKGYRKFSRIRFYCLIFLILIDALFSVLYHLKIFPDLKLFFLLFDGMLKVAFYSFGCLSTARILMQKQKITGQTIILGITSYLFIGITWSFIYYTIWQINPHAFHITVPEEYQLKDWSLVMYFSLTTLTTLGYGDIIPVDRTLMLAANFEAMAGAIYLTVIVARLVSLYEI
jgi:hypothetical protein